MVNFNFSFESGLSYNQILAFEMAGQIWSQYIQDDISLDIHVASTQQLPNEVLGGAILTTQVIALADVRSALAAKISSGDDLLALDAIDPTGQFRGLLGTQAYTGDTITLTQAQMEALGLSADLDGEQVDGYILFNDLSSSELDWSYDLARTASLNAEGLDLLSIALHEIGHVLGFVSGLDSPLQPVASDQLQQTTLLDLFRFSPRSQQQNAQELTPGEEAFFSIDGGRTSLAPFSSGAVPVGPQTVDGYQASHWGIDPFITNVGDRSNSERLFDAIRRTVDLVAQASPNVVMVSNQNTLVLNSNQTSNLRGYWLSGFASQLVLEDDELDLGVLDPTLAPGEQSEVTALDLQAFDILGYSIDATSQPLGNLLEDAKRFVADSFGLTLVELEQVLAQDQAVPLLPDDGVNNLPNDELLERRRWRRRVTSNASFWQEENVESTLQLFDHEGYRLLSVDDFDPIAQPSGQNPYQNLSLGHEQDLVVATEGQISVRTGGGQDFIVLGSWLSSFLAQDGDEDYAWIRDWSAEDVVLFHGDRSDYTKVGNDVYQGNELIATFDGGIAFELDSPRVLYSHQVYGRPEDILNQPNLTELLNSQQNQSGEESQYLDAVFESLEGQASLLESLIPSLSWAELVSGQVQLDNPTPSSTAITGDSSDDLLIGTSDAQILRGRRGNDQLVGGAGNDTLFGQGGADTLLGADSDHQGALERDILMGGKGPDTYILGNQETAFYHQNRRQDQALIKGFDPIHDQLHLHGQASDYQFNSVRYGTEILYQDDRIALLQKTSGLTIESSNVIFQNN